MRSKRQTVWLVSMLSLMVVLSAYYLFTEDGPNTKQAAGGQQATTMESGGILDNTGTGEDLNSEEVILEEVLPGGDQENAVIEEEAGAQDSEAVPGQTADNPVPAPADQGAADEAKDTATGNEGQQEPEKPDNAVKDEDVLKQLESQGLSAADSLSAYQFQRSEENSRLTDELIKKINEGSSLEEAAMAQMELNAMEEKEEKIFSIEERLQQKYANAAVTESDDRYKVVVVSEKLEAKEAVSIMDLVIQELGVTQDKVTVQYVTQ